LIWAKIQIFVKNWSISLPKTTELFRFNHPLAYGIIFSKILQSPSLPGYAWENYEDIAIYDSCRISCASRQTNETEKPYYSTITAKDGIPCTEGWNHGLCISGKCHIITCNGKLSLYKRTGFFSCTPCSSLSFQNLFQFLKGSKLELPTEVYMM